MDDSGTANSGTDENYPEDGAAQQDADGERPARQGLARYARPALIAGAVIAVVCVALLVIIFFLDSFNATVYSVGGKDVTGRHRRGEGHPRQLRGRPHRRHRLPGHWDRPGRRRRPGAVPAPERARLRRRGQRRGRGLRGPRRTVTSPPPAARLHRRTCPSCPDVQRSVSTMPKCPLAAAKDGHVPPRAPRNRWTCPVPRARREHNARAPEFTGNEFLALALTEC